MKLFRLFFTCCCCLFVFYSCKKSSDSPSNAISGNYKFVSVHATTSDSEQYTDLGVVNKTVTTSEYTSTNNTGSVVIDASNFTATGIGYSVSTIAHARIYEDGAIVDSLDLPFDVTIPASSSVSKYNLSGADSIHFTSGAFISGAGVSTGGAPSNGTYKLENGQLTIALSAVKDSVDMSSGTAVTIHQELNGTITLQKQ